MIYSLSICDTSAAVRAIYIVKVILTIITIAAPILLILSCMIDGIRVILSKDASVSGMLSNWSKRIIIAIVLFFLPNFVFLIGRVATGDTSVRNCYNGASLSRAESLAKKEKARSEAAINAWKQEQERKRKEAEERRRKEKEQAEKEKQERLREKEKSGSISGEDSYAVGWEANGNNVYSSNLGYVDTTKYVVKVTSGIDGSKQYKKLRFNKAVLDEADELLRETAVFVSNSPYVKYVQTAGAYVNKGGYHGMGLAIDLFNRYVYKHNGVNYYPYGWNGSREWNYRYKKFICDVCKGDETCPQNIAYHVYYEIWKPKGWCWGGNWSVESFDPMHFERTNKGCNKAAKNRITPKSCGLTSTTSSENNSGSSGGDTSTSKEQKSIEKPGVTNKGSSSSEKDKATSKTTPVVK